MTQATVGESCKGLHNALTNAIARRLPLGIARPLRIVRVRTYQMRNDERTHLSQARCRMTDPQSGHVSASARLGAMGNELPQLIVADVAAWRTWLSGHHDDSAGVWLILAKKGTTDPTRLT